MNFDLDEQQTLLDETLQRFVSNESGPGRVRAAFDGEASFDERLWRQLCDLDLFGIAVDEADGGAGLGLFELALAAGALGGAGFPGPFLEHVLATLAIAWGGDAGQRAARLPALLTGERRATIALAENGDRWLPEAWSLGGPRLNGRKRAVLHPSGVDLVVVGTAGGLAVVDLAQASVETQHVEPLDRTRRIGDLSFDGTEAERLAVDVRERVVDAGLLLLAADAAGGARRCVEMATSYAMEREQFGVTIGHFQAVKHQLADMAVEALPLRHLVWHAAAARDAGRPEAKKLITLAKSHATDRYVDIGRRTVEIYGGIGYTWDCDVHIFLKRAILDRAYLGTPACHRARVAGWNGWV